jgi:hypothetical protein
MPCTAARILKLTFLKKCFLNVFPPKASRLSPLNKIREISYPRWQQGSGPRAIKPISGKFYPAKWDFSFRRVNFQNSIAVKIDFGNESKINIFPCTYFLQSTNLMLLA